MKSLLKVGITGGIGSGKSIVSKIFHTLGVPIYNSDDRGKYLTKTNKNIVSQIKKEFGPECFDNSNNLIAQKLGAIVFNDESKLKVLNHIVHPEVAKDFETWLNEQTFPYILKESAIIFENDIQKSLDMVISVVSPLDMRIKNILARDPFRTENSIKSIIDKQMSDAEKIRLSDEVIYNDGQQSLIAQVLEIHTKILKRSNGRLQTS